MSSRFEQSSVCACFGGPAEDTERLVLEKWLSELKMFSREDLHVVARNVDNWVDPKEGTRKKYLWISPKGLSVEPLYFVLCEGVGCATAEISECDKGVRWEVDPELGADFPYMENLVGTFTEWTKEKMGEKYSKLILWTTATCAIDWLNSNILFLENTFGVLKECFDSVKVHQGVLTDGLRTNISTVLWITEVEGGEKHLKSDTTRALHSKCEDNGLLSDINGDGGSAAPISYACKQCRFVLFGEADVLSHKVGAQSFRRRNGHKIVTMEIGSDSHRATCTSLFLEDPPKWLRAEESSESTGKLHCPHCKSRCGSFNWAGSQCSCGSWVTPAFQVLVSRVDEKRHLSRSQRELLRS